MGVTNHNTIIATTWDKKEILRIRQFISTLNQSSRELFLFGGERMNGFMTIVMIPDGSKEGWAESNKGDEVRSRFIKELKKSNHQDGSNPWKFVEVGYGEYGQKVLQGNCQNCYSNLEYYKEVNSL